MQLVLTTFTNKR